MDIRVADKWQALPAGDIVVDTTSHSQDFKGLSPFILPDGDLFDGYKAYTVENAWQYAKVYKNLEHSGEPDEAYFAWAKEGWENRRGVRYTMGKGAVPEYTYWDGKRLSYIEARVHVYAPLYARSVVKSEAFKRLCKLVADNPKSQVWLRDFDGYDHVALGLSFEDVARSEKKKMGHGFVIAMLISKYDNAKIFRASEWLEGRVDIGPPLPR